MLTWTGAGNTAAQVQNSSRQIRGQHVYACHHIIVTGL